MNHNVFFCRQCGPAGAMLLRIPSSQNSCWKMVSPSWVSLSDTVLSVSLHQFCPHSTLCSAFLLFNMLWALIFHQSPTVRVTLSFLFLFCFPSSFLTPCLSLCILIVFLFLGSFPWDTEDALISKTLAFWNFAINLKKIVEKGPIFI